MPLGFREMLRPDYCTSLRGARGAWRGIAEAKPLILKSADYLLIQKYAALEVSRPPTLSVGKTAASLRTVMGFAYRLHSNAGKESEPHRLLTLLHSILTRRLRRG